MNIVKSFIVGMVIIGGCAVNYASGLKAVRFSIQDQKNYLGDTPVLVNPLKSFEVQFEEHVQLTSHPVAYVTLGSDIVARAISFDVNNFTLNNNQEGASVWAKFDSDCLPIGKEYVLHFAEGNVCSVKNSELTNNPVSEGFLVPENLGEATFDNSDKTLIECLESFMCYWKFEVDPIGSPKWSLYKDDELIAKYDAEIGWDWDMGYATLRFSEKKYFDDGVRYKIILPAGSVGALSRPDITNTEVCYEFTGLYGKYFSSYDSSFKIESIQDNSLSDLTAEYYFNVPIEPVPGMNALLVEEETEEVFKTIPIVFKSDSNWKVLIKFSDIFLKPKALYSLILPEGLLRETGTSHINRLIKTEFDSETADISKMLITDKEVTRLYDIMGREVNSPQPGSVYIRNGKKFILK